VDASWGASICLTAPKGRNYKLKVYSFLDRWNNQTQDPTPDGKPDGLVWSNPTGVGGTTCFYGGNVTPHRYGEYRFVVGIESVSGYSPYWPYWIRATK